MPSDAKKAKAWKMCEIAAEFPASDARCVIRQAASLLYQTQDSSRVRQALGVDGKPTRTVENRESASALCENPATSDLSRATSKRACSLVTEWRCWTGVKPGLSEGGWHSMLE